MDKEECMGGGRVLPADWTSAPVPGKDAGSNRSSGDAGDKKVDMLLDQMKNKKSELSTGPNGVRLSGAPPNDDITRTMEEMLMAMVQKKREALEKQMEMSYNELKTEHAKVKFLGQLIKAIHAATDKDGNFDSSKLNFESIGKEYAGIDGGSSADVATWNKIVEKAKTMGVEFPAGKVGKDGNVTFTMDQQQKLVKGIEMSIENLNFDVNKHSQKIKTYTDHLSEVYQIIQKLIQRLDQDKSSKARKFATGN